MVVTARLTEESVCNGSCGFTYDASVTNNVTIPTTLDYGNGANLTVTGMDLTGAVVTVGGIVVNLTVSNSTSLKFSYPALSFGSYEVKIMTATGYTHPAIMTKTSLWVNSVLSRTGGSLNGHRLSVWTNGFPSSVDKYLAINLICTNYSSPLQVTQVLPNIITF